MIRNTARLAFAAVLGFSAAGVLAEPVSYRIDPAHTDVFAQWNHFGYSSPSIHFGQVDGRIVHDAVNPANSSVEVTLPMRAMTSHVAALDEHLRSSELFDVERFPEARFLSTRVEASDDGILTITGDITIKDVTRPLVLQATLNRIGGHPATGQPTIGFNAEGVLKRSDFGLDLYAPGVGDEVRIRITTEASVPVVE